MDWSRPRIRFREWERRSRRMVGIFAFMTFLAALYMLGVLVFGGRINFWQAFAAINLCDLAHCGHSESNQSDPALHKIS